LDNAVIEARFFKRTDAGVRSDRPEPEWLEVHHEHKRGKHVNGRAGTSLCRPARRSSLVPLQTGASGGVIVAEQFAVTGVAPDSVKLRWPVWFTITRLRPRYRRG
jgi:hypothetical protein